MPKNQQLKKVLVIGSGPIVIGQAAEFDYAGTQACLTLKAEGIKTVLINSNPATIMTDKKIADKVYIEPLNVETIEAIIIKEKVDAILPTLGGQTALNLATQLANMQILNKYNVKLIGVNLQSIKQAEDRELFKQLIESMGLNVPQSKIVNSQEEGEQFLKEIDLPVIIRPAYTLGGTGGGIAQTIDEFTQLLMKGLQASPINQVLIETSIYGYKEIEYEVMCDNKLQAISICNMENINPVGIHTGDSIVVAPSQTLTDKEYQKLREISLAIIKKLKITGGCNVQLALDPKSDKCYIIEVNPRVSRSSALASKATGYPIAKIATLIAIGYNLDEITNPLTKVTSSAVEPSIDYVAMKFPQFPFDKIQTTTNKLGTQMQATGEVLAIDTNLSAAFLKAIRSLNEKSDYFEKLIINEQSTTELLQKIAIPSPTQIFEIFELIRRNIELQEICQITKIDYLFISVWSKIIEIEKSLATQKLEPKLITRALKNGFTIDQIEKLSKQKINFKNENKIQTVYKMIDSCAGEYVAKTPYYYSIKGSNNESKISTKPKIIVIGSGPIKISQGIEFDYATVHAIKALQKLNYEAIVINNNPETVSTDFELADKLYITPLQANDVLEIIKHEKPIGVIIQFGGQTAINLAQALAKANVQILGSSYQVIKEAEDRKLFAEKLAKLNIKQPKGITVKTLEAALKLVKTLDYPVICRPSFVIGGQAMEIINNEQQLINYFENIDQSLKTKPILIDQFINGKEYEIDVICDGKAILIPEIVEHLDPAGIHSGDSYALFPAVSLSEKLKNEIIEIATKICLEFKIVGLVNIQLIIKNNQVYVIEINPRASRTIPFINKAANINMIEIATKVICQISLENQGFNTPILKMPKMYTVKAPIFSFNKLDTSNFQRSPEMKSTGEIVGFGQNVQTALYKAFMAIKPNLNLNKPIYIANNEDQKIHQLCKLANFEIIDDYQIAKQLIKLQKIDVIVATNKNSNYQKLLKLGYNNQLIILDNMQIIKAFCEIKNSKVDKKIIELGDIK